MAYPRSVAALPGMLEHDRRRSGWSAEQAASRLSMSVRIYRELEAGVRSPSFETWDRICKTFGWHRRSWELPGLTDSLP